MRVNGLHHTTAIAGRAQENLDGAHLGGTLMLPPWLEARQDTIEAALPCVAVRVPSPARAAE